MSKEISRRSFLKGAAAGVLGVATTGIFSACTQSLVEPSPSLAPATGPEQDTKPYTYADTIKWDGEYDVLVMGFGGAGAVAAHYACKNGATVLVFDVAPEGHEGGNTRYAGQFVVIGDDKAKLMSYYKALSGGIEYDEEVLDVFTDGLLALADMMIEDYATTGLTRFRGVPATAWAIPEFPEFEGGDTIDAFSVNGRAADSALWKVLREKVYENKDMIDIWYEARGTALIQDPDTKTVLGMSIDRKGVSVNIRAKNGVVMACGGFENNTKLVHNYLSLPRFSPIGTLYNRGDGIPMVLAAGADLWHMNVYEGIAGLGGAGLDMGDAERSPYGSGNGLPGCESGSFILVGSDGSRYVNEVEYTRHGHVARHGEWPHPQHTKHNYIVIDQAHYENIVAEGKMDDNMLSKTISADTLDSLAEATGMNAKVLSKTVEKFNRYAKNGDDVEFGRRAETMTPIGSGPYYAFPMIARILNTQGGPRKNAKAQVISTEGKPIPHLYSAGEFGGLTSKNYQGATNLAECIIFGKIAGTNAAESKEELGTYTIKPMVLSNIAYTVGSGDEDAAASDVALGENEYLGVSNNGMGGEIKVKAKVENGVIKNVDIIAQSETAGISDPAISRIPAAIVEANSPNVDTVSGATITSRALIEAVKNALDSAGFSY